MESLELDKDVCIEVYDGSGGRKGKLLHVINSAFEVFINIGLAFDICEEFKDYHSLSKAFIVKNDTKYTQKDYDEFLDSIEKNPTYLVIWYRTDEAKDDFYFFENTYKDQHAYDESKTQVFINSRTVPTFVGDSFSLYHSKSDIYYQKIVLYRNPVDVNNPDNKRCDDFYQPMKRIVYPEKGVKP